MNETISQIKVNGTLYDIEAVGGGSVSSVVGQTGAITAEQVATALTSAGYALSNPDISIAADSGTSQLDMTAATVYKITAGNKSFIFKTPADSNTDVKVQQNAAITTAGAYPIILAYSTATSKVTNAVNKSAYLTYNPNTKALVTGGTVDGYTLAAASAKSVDTSISAGSSSANLPTSAAVAAFVEGKGYITTDNNTWRKVQLNGVDKLGTGTSTNPLNIKAGSNMTITESNGTFTFSSSFTDSDTNTAQLQVSDTTNKRINTAESTGKYIQFTGGTDKFTVSDGTNSFDVAVSHTNDGDTKNTTGTTNKAATKLFLAGAASQAANPVTYSNVNCYIGTDNCLYSNGSKVLTSGDGDTKNTTGTSNKTGTKMYLAAATEQSANPVTYSNSKCYIGTDNCLYSGGSKVLTGHQSVSSSNNTASWGSAVTVGTVGGTDLKFTMPSNPNTNTTYSAGTGLSLSGTTFSVSYGTAAGTACLGNDSRLSNSRPASDVYSWAKASSKPSYTLAEVGASMSATTITSNTSSTCSITGSGNAGKSEIIVYVNGGSSDLTVTVPTTYKTPKNAAIEVKCPASGYCEVNYINIGGTIYARGA